MVNFNFSWELKKDVFEIESIFNESLHSFRGEIEDFTEYLETDPLWKNIQEFVLVTYEYFGLERNLAIKIAVIFKMAYLANYIHESVKDDEEGQPYNQKLQFTILIGDYLFGKIMSLLLEAGGDMLVKSFANMLAEINEGLIIKYKVDKYSEEVIKNTKASYYSYTFLTAARLAGINSEKDLHNINDLGTSIGMVMYLIYNKGSHEQIRKHYLQAQHLFTLVNQDMKVLNSNLEKSLKEISDFSGGLSEVAVI